MNKIIIRKVNSTELDELLQLSVETFTKGFGPPVNTEENFKKYMEKSFSREKIKNELNNTDSAFYFAILENNKIGYLKINTGNSQTELKDQNSLEIERIYVLHEYQNLKIGQALFEYAVEIAKKQGKDFLWLGVWEHNTRAIRFYEKRGMFEFSRHSFMLGDDKQTDIMMKLQIE